MGCFQLVAGAAAVGIAASAAQAAWGLKYEVSPNGASWGPSIGVIPGGTVYFRMSAYFDPGTKVTSGSGIGNALVLSRFTGQQKISGAVAADSVTNVVRLAPNGNAALLNVSFSSSNILIGTTSATSFASFLVTDPTPYLGNPQTIMPILQGKLTLSADPTPRTLMVRNSTFGVGNSNGLNFYSDVNPPVAESGPPVDTPNHTDLNATIELKNSTCVSPTINSVGGGGSVAPSQSAVFSVSATDGAFYEWLKNGVVLTESSRIIGVGSATLTVHDPYPSDSGSYRARVYNNCGTPTLSSPVLLSVICGGDLNRDAMVDDADFVVFVQAYTQLLCPVAPDPCPADLNLDGFVDDGDFTIFASQYNDLLCPE
ncbi:MAG: hypothetical protein KF805_13880 [Phycisphaeraceae bacterium]|nr:hypothetical protein [Phycisphaeraceae bacterium]